MVVIENPQEYKLLNFDVASDNKHKYIALLQNKRTGKQKRVPFGAIKTDGTPYQHYRDRIGHFARYDHNDKERRKRYLSRHRGEDQKKFSSGWFSIRYLW